MRQHIIPTVVSSIVAAVVALGVATYSRPNVTVVPTGAITSKAAARAAVTVWPGLEQSEIDAMTRELKKLPPFPVTIFCASDAICGDLAGDLENALESAHWVVEVKITPMPLLPGVATSTTFATLFPSRYGARQADEVGERVISIGPKPKP